ncbi:MAG: hypothetical protein WCG94_03135 [Methanothrix sp.]
MNKKNNIILKAAAIVMVLIGLLAMLVAWELMLVSGIHNSTVVVLEMGGVVICMAGYFLWRRVRVLEKDAKMQIQAVQFAAKEDTKE